MSNPLPLSIKFDFRHYIPNQDLSAGIVQLDSSDCGGDSFIVTLLVDNLIPGHAYRTNYELISPITEQNVFNPSVSDLFASFSSQNFVTSVKLPPGPNISNSYILKATVRDITEGAFENTSSTQINLICGIELPTFRLEMLDPDLIPVPPDNIINIGDCVNPFPLICNIKDAVPGKEYSYEFFGNPPEGIVFENKTGNIFAGDINQNFNTKVALTGYPYVFVHASATELNTGISRNSQPVLLKCFQTNECDVVLPTGVNISVGVPVFKKCANRGLTTASISALFGGKGFSIGDKLTTVGGGGFGAEIEILFGGITQETFSSFVGGSGFNIGDLIEVTGGGGSGGLIKIISGGLTNASITNLTGCSNFKVGDLLTTIGGGGHDALISVTATGLNGSVSAYSVINPGYGYTNVPSGVKTVSGNGSCASAVFNGDNFTIPCVGGITYSSSAIMSGNGYNIGEIIDIVGGGGSGAQIKVLTGSLTSSSISLSGGSGYNVGDYISTIGGEGKDTVIRIASTGNNGSISGFDIINPGHDFSAAPTGLISLTGSGLGATFTANANNFSITSNGALTKASVVGLINSGTGYTVGSELIAVGGNGNGGVLEVISVNNGQISDFIIKDGGSGYSSAPQLINIDQVAVINQPSWNISQFTQYSYAVINAGCGYINSPTSLVSTNGDGVGASFLFDSSAFTDYAFIVVNTGSGYVDAPTGIVIRSGDGAGIVATFNDNNFTIPCAGGITYESINNLIGKSVFILGEELVADGGEGSGGRIKITGVSNTGAVTSFVVLNAGCGYTSEPLMKRLNGTVINGVSFDVEDFTDLAIVVTNPGSGFFESPNGLSVLTGNGEVESVFVQFNSDNFIELVGPNPTPSSTPTPTITPSQSEPVRCNDLQTAGGQNTVSSTKLGVSASAGQNYIIVANADGLSINAVVFAAGLQAGTYITKIENYFANFDNRTEYKKLTLSNNVISNIAQNSVITIYSTDTRLVRVPYWPGTMTFSFDAYSVPDRFKVFAVPIDTRKPEVLLFDSGYRGGEDCGYAVHIPNIGGGGSVQLNKPDGCIFIKVTVEAPCDGTAWEYSLSCPERVFTTVSSTPTPTPTTTPTN
jgi:hypothetical protein